MRFSYKPLFRLLLDRDMTKTDLRTELGFSSATLAKLGKGEPLSGINIGKLCMYFRCQVGDIVEVTWDDANEPPAKLPPAPQSKKTGDYKPAPKREKKISGRRESNPRHKLGKLG